MTSSSDKKRLKGEYDPRHIPAVFWITYALIIAATVTFITASFSGMGEILDEIKAPNSTATAVQIGKFENLNDENSALLLWASLEHDALQNRQARAESMLSTRTWIRFMNTAFGSILIMSGAIFLLARVRMGRLDAQTETAEFKVALATSSPGIVMVAIGALMTTAPLYVSQPINITDGHAYPPPFGTLGSKEASSLTREQIEAYQAQCRSEKHAGQLVQNSCDFLRKNGIDLNE